MSSGRRKGKTIQTTKTKNIIDVLKKIENLEEITEIKRSDKVHAASFKLKETTFVIEKHSRDNIKLLRIVNSFNSKALEIKNDFDSLISTANKFNARSIGIKCAIVERDDIKIIRFNIEEIAIDESMLNISSESIYMMSSILSGAPSLFKDLAQEPEQEK